MAMKPIFICNEEPRGLFLFDNFSIVSSLLTAIVSCLANMETSTIAVFFTATAILFSSVELAAG